MRTVALLAAGMAVFGCSQPAGPPLTVSNIVILEPLPGSAVAAGYLELENHTRQPLTIARVTSPDFATVDMHETVIQDDIARMISIAPLVIEPQSAIIFEPGGRHLMLSGSSKTIVAGVPVSIEFHDDGNGLVTVATTVRSRDDLQD
jgi:hypothetical protein